MARKFYTCIIVPDASQQLHKLRIPVKTLYVLASVGLVSFFVAVALGFNYIGMASRMSSYQTLEAENAQLKAKLENNQKEITSLRKENMELSKRKEDASWVAKSEYERVEKLLREKEKEMEKLKGK